MINHQVSDMATYAARVLGPSLRRAEKRTKTKTKRKQRGSNEAVADHIALAMGLNESKTQRTASLDHNPKLDRIIDKFFKQLESARNIFREYCTTALQEGFTPQEAWDYIRKRLNSHVPRNTLYRWAEADLPLEAKRNRRPRNSVKEIPIREITKGERYSVQEQPDSTEKQGPWEETAEIYEIPLSQARPQDVDKYDELNCRRLLREALILIAQLQKQEADQ